MLPLLQSLSELVTQTANSFGSHVSWRIDFLTSLILTALEKLQPTISTILQTDLNQLEERYKFESIGTQIQI